LKTLGLGTVTHDNSLINLLPSASQVLIKSTGVKFDSTYLGILLAIGGNCIFVSPEYGVDPAQGYSKLWYYNGNNFAKLTTLNVNFSKGVETYYESVGFLGIGYGSGNNEYPPPYFFAIQNTLSSEYYEDGNGVVNLNPGRVTTNGTVNLVGDSNCKFLSSFVVGGTIRVVGESVRTIATITDDQNLTVTVAFSTSGSSKTYYGSNRIVGTDTVWTTDLAAGDIFRISEFLYDYTISSVVSDTVAILTVTPGANVKNIVGRKYGIINPTYPDAFMVKTDPHAPAKVGINIDASISALSPTAQLHIAGGLADAETAPIKIDPGMLNDTPESGAIESDGTHIYWVDSGGVRRQLD